MQQTDSHLPAQAGQHVNLAPFSAVRWWTGAERYDLRVHDIAPTPGGYRPARHPDTGEWHIGLEWGEPQTVAQVTVRYAAGQSIAPGLRVKYWRKNWPTIAPERMPGARRGWIGSDDPWHGSWTTIRAERSVHGALCTFTFDPVDLAEIRDRRQLEEAEDYQAPFRRTLKIRLVCGGDETPLIQEIRAFSPAVWQEMEADIHFLAAGECDGRAEIAHGHLLDLTALDNATVQDPTSWHCQPAGGAVRLRLLYAGGDPSCGDRTIVTVRTAARSFSILARDLERGPIHIPDYGILVGQSGLANLDAVLARQKSAPKPLYDRVIAEPEHSLQRALADIPPLDVTKQNSYGPEFGLYVILGVEAGRQEFGLRYNGELFISKQLLKPTGRDLARLTWPGIDLRYRFGTGDPPDFRLGRNATRQSLLDNCLPVFTTQWLDRELEWTQTVFAALLHGPMTGPDDRRGDEDTVTMLHFTVRNATPGRKRAQLWLAISPQEELCVQDGLVLATARVVPDAPVARQWRVDPYRARVLRCTVQPSRGGVSAVAYAEGDAARGVNSAVLYAVDLAQNETATLDLVVPFASLDTAEEWAHAASLRWEQKLADAAAYWRTMVGAGGSFDTPDAILPELHKAVQTHVAISGDKDLASGLIFLPAATYSYPACGNEACWQITMLDQAGQHQQAERYLETFLRTQGAIKPDGRFTSADGALQGFDLDEGQPKVSLFGYNLDQGCIMECLAEHYRLSGDRDWLARVAPNLLAACDFVIRERATTKVSDHDGRPAPEWGLMPAGHLEDNPEWRHWFAVNAHAHGGMAAIAGILSEIGHPDAARLAGAASNYRQDIRQAARRAMIESPVVQVRDGTYIPHMPTRSGLRGRERGWFREAAYGPLHLLDGDVFEPWAEEMTSVLKDLEDNLFVSREWGRPVDVEQHWFSHGGVAIQSNLMDLAIDYLRRDQIEHALRALFNNIGSHLYPSLRVFTEHPVIELGHGVGPFYKSSDESKFLLWLRACLIMEDGARLHLGRGVPRAWFAPGQSFGVNNMATHFGPMTYHCTASGDTVSLRVTAPSRDPLDEMIIHLRHPQRRPMQAVTVDGAVHTDFDPSGETVRLRNPTGTITVHASY